MATITINKAPYKSFGGIRLVSGTINFDSSYPTGGELVDIPLKEVHGMFIENKAGYMFEYDRANKKVKAYTPVKAQAAHTHTENTAAAYTQNATTAAGGAISASTAAEVANGTNLSTVTEVAFLAWGY